METAMGAKDTVRALLDRLPDDCTLEDVIERLLTLEAASSEESRLPPLTPAQRQALDEELARIDADPDSGTPWREALDRIGRRR